jgi:hypothetical protein
MRSSIKKKDIFNNIQINLIKENKFTNNIMIHYLINKTKKLSYKL